MHKQKDDYNDLATISFSTNLEALAAALHDNWAHWTEYMLNNLTPENIARWKNQIKTEYRDLPEDQKPSDRRAALKLIERLKNI